MKLLAFSIFDEKAKAFCIPFFVHNVNLALRSFGDAVLNESTGISKHAGDYKLYKLGEYDDNSGMLTSLDIPEFIANALDFLPVEVKKEA
nr:MAG: nonstructural protein [Microviridae sp.]